MALHMPPLAVHVPFVSVDMRDHILTEQFQMGDPQNDAAQQSCLPSQRTLHRLILGGLFGGSRNFCGAFINPELHPSSAVFLPQLTQKSLPTAD